MNVPGGGRMSDGMQGTCQAGERRVGNELSGRAEERSRGVR